MRTITVCTLTLGLLTSGLALASSGTPTKPAATAAAATPTTPPVQIGDEPAAPAAKPAPLVKRTAKVTPKIVSTAGEVTAIDVNKKLLTLKEAKSVANFSISSSTHITLADGKAGHESDVKVGARVTVTYDAHGKTLVARSVKIG